MPDFCCGKRLHCRDETAGHSGDSWLLVQFRARAQPLVLVL